MALQCNINAGGAKLRLYAGILAVIVGIALQLIGLFDGVSAEWRALTIGVGIALVPVGAFCIYEGVNRWCAVKALFPKFFGAHKAE